VKYSKLPIRAALCASPERKSLRCPFTVEKKKRMRERKRKMEVIFFVIGCVCVNNICAGDRACFFVLVCNLLHYKDRIFYLFPDLCSKNFMCE